MVSLGDGGVKRGEYRESLHGRYFEAVREQPI